MAPTRRGKGESAIGRLPTGRRYAEVSLGFCGTGRRVRKRVYAADKKAALAELRKLQDPAGRGAVPRAGTMTTGQLLDDWLAAMKASLAADRGRQRVRKEEEREALGRLRPAAKR